MTKVLWWILIIASVLWLVFNLLSIINYTMLNTSQVIHPMREFGETPELMERGKEISGLIWMFILFSITNLFSIIVGVVSLRKSKK